jgi:hypothetical protein
MDNFAYNPVSLRRLLVRQKSNATCGLAALCIGLGFFGIRIKQEVLEAKLGEFGLRIFENGVYTAYLAALAKTSGANCTLLMPKNSIYEFTKNLSFVRGDFDLTFELIREYESVLPPRSTRRYFYKSLVLALGLGAKIRISGRNVRFEDILTATKRGSAALVDVTSKLFYRINDERWSHVLTLIPFQDSFAVMDCLDPVGRDFYSNWDIIRKRVLRYNWLKWNGQLLELSASNSART